MYLYKVVKMNISIYLAYSKAGCFYFKSLSSLTLQPLTSALTNIRPKGLCILIFNHWESSRGPFYSAELILEGRVMCKC